MYYADLDTLTKARLAQAGAYRPTEPTLGWVRKWLKRVLARLEHRK